MKFQSLKQIFKIVEWKDGCVYRTKPVGYAWVTHDYNPPNDGNLQFHSVSTSVSVQLGHRTVRSTKDETPDMDITTIDNELADNAKRGK